MQTSSTGPLKSNVRQASKPGSAPLAAPADATRGVAKPKVAQDHAAVSEQSGELQDVGENGASLDNAFSALQQVKKGPAEHGEGGRPEEKEDEEEGVESANRMREGAGAPTELVEHARKLLKAGAAVAEAGEHAAGAVENVASEVGHEVARASGALAEVAEAGEEALGVVGGTLKAVGAGVGVLGIYAGAKEIQAGLHAKSTEKKVNHLVTGSLNTGAGSAAIAEGVGAGAKVLGVASSALPALELAGKFAGPLAGAAGIVSGGFQIYDGVHNPNAEKGREQVTAGGLKALGGSLIIAGTAADATVVGAAAGVPLQVAGAALTVAGLAYEHSETVRHVVDGAVDLAGSAAKLEVKAARAVVNAEVKLAQAEVRAVKATAHAVGHAAHVVGHEANVAVHAMGHAAHAIGQEASHVAHTVEHAAAQAVHSVEHKLANAEHAVENVAERAWNSLFGS